MSIESKYDVAFVARLAMREKQVQQSYRPIIAVHKWFARRPGTLFRALIISEFGDGPLPDLFFRGNEFSGRKVADPFMGGGTPLIEANRLGCDVTGVDINPMSAWIVREEIEHLDLASYENEASRLLSDLRTAMEGYYLTNCPLYGDSDVPVKYFLWVKTIDCKVCAKSIDLFPSYLLSKDSRHPKNVLVCPDCGQLNEVADPKNPGVCESCDVALLTGGPARRGRCVCPHCGHDNRYPSAKDGPLRHRLFAIEYFNPLRPGHKGRFFKKPDEADLARLAAAEQRWSETRERFVPDQEILPGDETSRLHRWGYGRYREMFNERQLLGLELSCRIIDKVQDVRVRYALATNLSDLLRYQNMLCRYDTWALKSLDIFSVHGFPVGLIQCESNLLGITNGHRAKVGSGAWPNIIDKYAKAKRYCDNPFETQRHGSRNVRVHIEGEWIGEVFNNESGRREVSIQCADACEAKLEPESLDAVFTDPPYFGNVQYGELMDFCYVWLRRLIGSEPEGFDRASTRAANELTGNVTESRGLDHFAEGLAAVYSNMAQALRPGAPLTFTFHHNRLEVYCAVGVAVLDAGLTCSASLPCPTEMAGSIHIRGTASSIIDTVFVCRDQGEVPQQWLFESTGQLATIVTNDLAQLAKAGRNATRGDTRCVVFGHLTRMAIWNLRKEWDADLTTREKLDRFKRAVNRLTEPEMLIEQLAWGRNGTTPPALSPQSDGPETRTLGAVSF